jgi:carbon storage regulator CsrA
MALW